MNLNTHPENRKDMVKAISELTELPSAYMGMPSAAFQIGPITVNRDGTIDCEDETMIETIKPMLIEHDWLDAEAEPETSAEAPDDSKELPEDTEPIRVAQMDITMPLENWTVGQMTNLLRMIYSKQYLINRMLDYDMLYIEESFIAAISENPPAAAADFEERMLRAIEADCVRGFRIADLPVVEVCSYVLCGRSEEPCDGLRCASATEAGGFDLDAESLSFHRVASFFRFPWGVPRGVTHSSLFPPQIATRPNHQIVRPYDGAPSTKKRGKKRFLPICA